MRHFLRPLVYFLAAWGVFLMGPVKAQNGAHFNNAELRRESDSTVAVTLYLNWPQVLHQLLAPQVSFKVFLKTYLELTDLQLEREMAKLGVNLTTHAHLTLPSSAKVNFKQPSPAGVFQAKSYIDRYASQCPIAS